MADLPPKSADKTKIIKQLIGYILNLENAWEN
jgi:hypothetical protein